MELKFRALSSQREILSPGILESTRTRRRVALED